MAMCFDVLALKAIKEQCSENMQLRMGAVAKHIASTIGEHNNDATIFLALALDDYGLFFIDAIQEIVGGRKAHKFQLILDSGVQVSIMRENGLHAGYHGDSYIITRDGEVSKTLHNAAMAVSCMKKYNIYEYDLFNMNCWVKRPLPPRKISIEASFT